MAQQSSTDGNTGTFDEAKTKYPVPQPLPHHHLVYTGLDRKLNIKLYIWVGQPALGAHDCNKYCPNRGTGIVDFDLTTPSPLHTVEELGWFADPLTFHGICVRQAVPPNQLDQAATFNAWKSVLLRDLGQNYGHLWTPNNANFI